MKADDWAKASPGVRAALSQLLGETNEIVLAVVIRGPSPHLHVHVLESKPSAEMLEALERATASYRRLLQGQAPSETTDSPVTLASRLLDMVERVEWVRAEGGRHHVCAFCGAVSERDDGPGHTDACEWMQATRVGNELRLQGLLR